MAAALERVEEAVQGERVGEIDVVERGRAVAELDAHHDAALRRDEKSESGEGGREG